MCENSLAISITRFLWMENFWLNTLRLDVLVNLRLFTMHPVQQQYEQQKKVTCIALMWVRFATCCVNKLGRVEFQCLWLLNKPCTSMRFEGERAHLACVKQVPLLKTLDSRKLTALVKSLELIKFKDGAKIIRQGDEGDVEC